MLSDTVNALFVTSAPSPITLTPSSVIAAFAAGTSVALLSALIPAREASRVEPAEAMRRANNNKTAAAALLGMTREGLRKKMVRLAES